MESNHAATTDAPPGLGFRIEKHGNINVLTWDDDSCRPATESEVALWKIATAPPARSHAEYVIELLIAGGNVNRDKVNQARGIANDVLSAAAQEAVAWRIDGPAVDGSTFTQFVTDSEFANLLRRAGIEITVSPLYAAPVAAAPVDDGMLPDALVPYSKEWYTLCERRFAVDKIKISGDLACAIVDAISARASTPAAPGIDHAEMVKSNLRSIKRLATVFPISHVSAANIMDEANHAMALIDADSKGGIHPDDAAVDAFAVEMRVKLADARAKGRGGWQIDEPGMQQHLSDLLREHVEKGDPRDVANFCMFLHQRGEGISPKGGSDAEPMFYIQDTRQFVGNCPLWWAPNGAGYVVRLDEAGRFTEQDAVRQNRTRDTDVPWPCAEIDKIARLTVDHQHMRPRHERLAELQATSADVGGSDAQE